MDGMLEWIRNTAIYKDDKLWNLLCASVPTLEVFFSFIVGLLVNKFRKKTDKDTNVLVEKNELKYKNLLLEKDREIMRLKKENKTLKKKINK